MDGSEWFLLLLFLVLLARSHGQNDTTSSENPTEVRIVSEPLTKVVSHHDPCTFRLESALGGISTRRSSSGSSHTLDLSGYALHQPLRTAPYEMYVTDMKVRMPTHPSHWARIDNCRYNPSQAVLQARLVFKDLSVSGAVKLYNEADTLHNPKIATPAERCQMMVRLRKAGIGFTVVPQQREGGGLSVSTTATFLDPQFVSVHAYGCDNPDLLERRLQDEDELDMGREMEDVFLRGIQPLLTTYLEKQLHPALRDTLMINMGYSVSYGR
ncbi:uncharacterized protein LOC129004416 [Macrosteles quadrilineatus]|uniref:uncharacterized protein LOC129004416 n=1 Tax=Macrosteles quadrilineatus TaxID=74068 RepID=UPI0023E17323|nr:uncharacterized protein LOC129003949 isoform X2 [Macrosteles quadrilineatus]XP_054288968.1 uncharacterized protein LOC129004416 [Macrosteles quadrilineatus]